MKVGDKVILNVPWMLANDTSPYGAGGLVEGEVYEVVETRTTDSAIVVRGRTKQYGICNWYIDLDALILLTGQITQEGFGSL